MGLVCDIGLGGRRSVVEHFVFRTLYKRLVDLRVLRYLYSPALEITENGVVIETSGWIVSLPAETVVLALGAQSVNELAQKLEGAVLELYVVGDCAEPWNASAATYEAAQAALNIKAMGCEAGDGEEPCPMDPGIHY